MSLHRRIITVLRTAHAAKPTELGCLLDDYPDDIDAIRAIFQNYRGGTPGEERGFLLTDIGFGIMRVHFTAYDVRFDPVPIYNARYLLFLERAAAMPWHIDKEGTLWLFDAQFAMRAKLVGNMDALMTAFNS